MSSSGSGHIEHSSIATRTHHKSCASTSNVASDDYYSVARRRPTVRRGRPEKGLSTSGRQGHPDKWSSKSPAEQKAAEETGRRVAEAYDALSDPQKRAAYDRYGKDGSARRQ